MTFFLVFLAIFQLYIYVYCGDTILMVEKAKLGGETHY